jgi:hypothetical protein
MTKQELRTDAEVKAAKVRALAQEGLNKTEIARATGVSRRQVGRILVGTKQPTQPLSA